MVDVTSRGRLLDDVGTVAVAVTGRVLVDVTGRVRVEVVVKGGVVVVVVGAVPTPATGGRLNRFSASSTLGSIDGSGHFGHHVRHAADIQGRWRQGRTHACWR